MANVQRALSSSNLALQVLLASFAGSVLLAAEGTIVKATGKPAEGSLAAFLGKPLCQLQCVFEGGGSVREPYLAVAADGTIIVIRNNVGHLRHSSDGGETWSEIISVPIRHSDSNIIVDELSGQLLSLRLWDGPDRAFRSVDGGRTWSEQPIELDLAALQAHWQEAGRKRRTSRSKAAFGTSYYLHNNASEAGITLRYGRHRGRLVVTGTFRPHAKEHPSDRRPEDAIYSCAFYSNDGGRRWYISELFPEGYTEEAGLVELHDGRIYYNTRSHRGFYDKARARPLGPDAWHRREAWSADGGRSWKDYRISKVLVDGGGYNRGYGMKGGLTRLPVKGRDILIYSNADTAGGPREKLTVWASFDGGRSWPLKRLLYPGPAAYSSLGAGRPGTPSEGKIFLLFEGGAKGVYSAMQLARFNLSWLLQGTPTGDGKVPDWAKK